MSVQHKISHDELSSVVQDVLTAAMQQPGVTAAEVGGSANVGLTAKVRLGEVDVVEFHRDKFLGITVYKGQSKGSATVTDLTAEALQAAVRAACRIADYTQPDPFSGLADKNLLATDFPDLDLYHATEISAEEAMHKAKTCEAAALAYDPAITNSEGGVFSTTDQLYVYGNSNDFLATYAGTRYSAYCIVIGQRGESMQRDYDFTVARSVHDLQSLEQVGKHAAQKTLARLGARKIKTGQAKVLFAPKIAASLWSTLIAAISGGNLFRKGTFLLDRLHTKVFPEFVNITEEPHLPKGLGSAPFDDEGVATKFKYLIKEGILDSYLLSSYSARKLGMQTTGNSGGVHNMLVQPGTQDFAQLLKDMQTGLVVTELMGNGTNLITGDYSHGAVGFWVENGEIAYPVEEITIAGNLNEMFQAILAIGNDVDRRSNIMTGSVLIEKMIIAGN